MMSSDLDAEIKSACCCLTDEYTWGEWIEGFKTRGIKILQDDSGYAESKVMTAEMAEAAVRMCQLEFDPIEEIYDPEVMVAVAVISEPTVSKSVETLVVDHVKSSSPRLTVGEWRRRYGEMSKTPPVGEFITAERGDIRLGVEYNVGKPPFIFTRIYLSGVVGSEPKWYAQGNQQSNTYGWKVVILPKARDAIIKKFGVDKDFIYVKMIRVIKLSDSKLSLLAEVSQWSQE